MINEYPINHKPINVRGPWTTSDEIWYGGVSGTLKTAPETYTATRNWFVALTPSAPPDDPDIPEGAIGISTIEQLQLIGNDPAYPLDGDYVLTQDIDASDTETWNDGAGFEPIGSFFTLFTGTLDGQGYGVTDLYINRPTTDYIGLFGLVSGTITNVYTTGTITGSNYVGGVCGGHGGTITKCYSECAVSGGNDIGGLFGVCTFGDTRNCYATGAVNGNERIGGLCGQNYDSTVTNCYATGAVTGTSSVGGLVGANFYGTVTASYYDTQTTGQADNTGKGAPRTTAAMYQQATFTGWDFGVVWTIIEDTDYPRLEWESAGT